MTLTQRAFQHNSSAFVAELHQAAAARRLHNDLAAAIVIDRTTVALQAGEEVENEWTIAIARRFLDDTK
jgi:hypothetical protein